MRVIIAALIALTTINSNAQLLRVIDGLTARCESSVDKYKYDRSDVFSFSNARVIDRNDYSVVVFDVNFYSCETVNGKYGFSKIKDYTKTKLIKDEVSGYTLAKIVKSRHIVATNEQYQVISRAKLHKTKQGYKVVLPVDNSLMNENRFMNAQNKGTHYFDLNLSTIKAVFELETQGPEFFQTSSASYRMFIDLKNKKANFN